MAEKVEIIVRIRDAASRGLRKVGTSLKKVGAEAKTVGTVLKSVQGQLLALGATVAVGAVIRDVVKTFVEFDDVMRAVGAVSRATAEEFEMLREKAKEMGATNRFTASQAAEGLRFLAMAGFNATQATEALPSVLNLAAAAAIELGQAADITTNIMSAFGLEVEDLGAVNDVLVGTFTSSNTTLLELGEAFKMVGPIARGLEGDFEDLLGTLGVLSKAGFRATLAGTGLRGALNALFNPTKEEEKLMADLSRRIGGVGLQVKNTQGQFIGFVEIIEQLEKAGIGADESLKLFGLRAGPAMQALLTQGSAALKDFVNKLKEGEVTTKEVAEFMEKGLGGAFRELRSASEAVKIELGELFAEDLINIVKDVRDGVLGWVKSIRTMKESGDLEFILVAFRGVWLILKLVLQTIGAIVKAVTGPFVQALAFIGALDKQVSDVEKQAEKLRKEVEEFNKEMGFAVDETGNLVIAAKKVSGPIGRAGAQGKDLTKAIRASAEELSKFEKTAVKTYNAATKAAQKYKDQVLAFEAEIRNQRLTTEDILRNLARKGLTERQKFDDERLQAEQRLTKARALLAQGLAEDNRRLVEESIKLAEKSRSQFATLAREVKQDYGEAGVATVKTLRETTQIATEGVQKTGAFIEQALSSQRDVAKDGQTQMQKLAETAKKVLDELAAKREANIDIILRNLQDAQEAINKLIQDETKHIKVVVEREERTGAQRGMFIKGYGGGDTVPAALERGEVVLRKEAVRKYGAGLFLKYNTLQMKVGGLVDSLAKRSYQGGGLVEGMQDFGKVELVVGDRAYPVMGERDVILQLKEHLTREHLARAG